jgi:hypothetical protein
MLGTPFPGRCNVNVRANDKGAATMAGNVLTGEGEVRKAGERRDQGEETKMGGDGRGRTAPLELGAD